jgi:3-hydroxyacyl-[acyl-carrier-protein] dehydratase
MADIRPESVLTVERLRELLPHRYPMLLVDKVIDMAPDGSNARGIKGVTANEPFFPGHFPAEPVFPGVLMVEAMAQAAAAYTAHYEGFDMDDKVVYMLSISNVRFRAPVRPGDLLELPVEVRRKRPPVWKFAGRAEVRGTVCAEAEFSAMLVEPK